MPKVGAPGEGDFCSGDDPHCRSGERFSAPEHDNVAISRGAGRVRRAIFSAMVGLAFAFGGAGAGHNCGGCPACLPPPKPPPTKKQDQDDSGDDE